MINFIITFLNITSRNTTLTITQKQNTQRVNSNRKPNLKAKCDRKLGVKLKMTMNAE